MPRKRVTDLSNNSRSTRRNRKRRKNETPIQRAYLNARINQRMFERGVLLKAAANGYSTMNYYASNDHGEAYSQLLQDKTFIGSQYYAYIESKAELLKRGFKADPTHNSLCGPEEKIAPYNYWTDSLIQSLLQEILEAIQGNPESFEKPTSKTFYELIREKSQMFMFKTWRGLKYRMSIMKTAYYLAALKSQEQDTQTNVYCNGQTFKNVYQICPHWDILDVIFNKETTKPTIAYDHVEAQMDEDSDTDTKPTIASEIVAVPEYVKSDLNNFCEIELKFEVQSHCSSPEPESSTVQRSCADQEAK